METYLPAPATGPAPPPLPELDPAGAVDPSSAVDATGTYGKPLKRGRLPYALHAACVRRQPCDMLKVSPAEGIFGSGYES
jgi:hypothetical protein